MEAYIESVDHTYWYILAGLTVGYLYPSTRHCELNLLLWLYFNILYLVRIRHATDRISYIIASLVIMLFNNANIFLFSNYTIIEGLLEQSLLVINVIVTVLAISYIVCPDAFQ